MNDKEKIKKIQIKKKVLLISFILSQIGLIVTSCAGFWTIEGIYEKKLSYNPISGRYYHAQVGATASYNLTILSICGMASMIVATICLLFALVERKKSKTETASEFNSDQVIELQSERSSLFTSSIAYYVIGGLSWLVLFAIGAIMNS
ncbi:MAG: hypothetical protein IJP98_06395 [Clostridia bacterium]|nr:hypothetical protein [Clostridia bacterium]